MEITWIAALTAGVLSFISPCVLPLVPAYLSFMTGISVDALRQAESVHDRRVTLRVVGYSAAFVMGFSCVFIILGASASLAGRLLLAHLELLAKIGGVAIVVMGVHYMGVFRLGWLNMSAHLRFPHRPAGLTGAFVMGLAFAFGWTPCVGPILAAILAVAGLQQTVGEGVILLAAYSAGLGIPFLLAGWAIDSFLGFFTRIHRHLHKVEVVSGSLLVVVGILIFFGNLNMLSTILLELMPGLARLG